MKIDTHAHDQQLADDDIPMLTELPVLPRTAMPAPRVQARYHALLRELDRSGGARAKTTTSALRRRSLRWKLTVPGLALGVLAATLALGYGPGHGSSGGAQGSDNAALVASWTAIPTAATDAQTRAAVKQCSNTTPTVVVAEQRGDVTAVLLTVGDIREACVVGKGHSLSVEVWPASSKYDDFGTRVLGMGPFPAAFEVGRVAMQVATATVTLSNGRVVTATVKDGWAFVWWPGSATAKTVTEYKADGTVAQTVSNR